MITPLALVTTGPEMFYDCDGGFILVASILNQQTGAATSELEQDSPIPVDAATAVRFMVAEPGHSSLIIYNVLGQPIRTVVNEPLS